MKKLLGVLLCACLAIALASPAASALSEKDERSLQLGQRSLANPGGAPIKPKPTGILPMHPGTLNAGRVILKSFLQQLLTNRGDPGDIMRVLEYAPIVLKQEQGKVLVDFEDSTLNVILKEGLCDMLFVLLETDAPDVYRIASYNATRGGEVYLKQTYTLFDAKNGTIMADDGRGIIGIGYDYDIKNQTLLTSPKSWHTDMGFNPFFDMGAWLLGFYLNTERVRFQYNGRDYMLQLWKGLYWGLNGCEIGLYEKEPGNSVFYDTSETMLEISMQVYQGGELYLDYGPAPTWWAGGFRHAKPIFEQLTAPNLRMAGTIRFEEKGMLDAFLAAFEKDKPADMTGSADGLLFTFDWKAK